MTGVVWDAAMDVMADLLPGSGMVVPRHLRFHADRHLVDARNGRAFQHHRVCFGADRSSLEPYVARPSGPRVPGVAVQVVRVRSKLPGSGAPSGQAPGGPSRLMGVTMAAPDQESTPKRVRSPARYLRGPRPGGGPGGSRVEA